MKSMFGNFADRRAFTLMELMIVILIIGILMSGVFMLMSVASKHGDIAQTRAKVQRMQNAISGFYAAYGTYPPVDNHYASLDPFINVDDDFDEPINGSGGLDASACRWSCRAQPVAFEYPCAQEEDAMINDYFRDADVLTPNQVFGNAASYPETDWDTHKMFKFGLMSFLLPRITIVGIPSTGGFNEEQPISGFYESGQWESSNKKSSLGSSGGNDLVNALRSQGGVESRAVAKWLPNLEGMCAQLNRTIMNVSLNDSKSYFNDKEMDTLSDGLGGDAAYRGPYKSKSGQKTVLNCATVKDSWSHDLYYYSAPPYQSYKVWSAGPDGKTFPPWIPLGSLSSSDQETVAGWIKDDISGID